MGPRETLQQRKELLELWLKIETLLDPELANKKKKIRVEEVLGRLNDNRFDVKTPTSYAHWNRLTRDESESPDSFYKIIRAIVEVTHNEQSLIRPGKITPKENARLHSDLKELGQRLAIFLESTKSKRAKEFRWTLDLQRSAPELINVLSLLQEIIDAPDQDKRYEEGRRLVLVQRERDCQGLRKTEGELVESTAMENLGTTDAALESSFALSFGHGPSHTATCPQLHHSLLFDHAEAPWACVS